MLVTDAVCLKVLDHNHLLLAVGNSLHHYHQTDDRPPGDPATVRIYGDLLPEHIHGILSVPHHGSRDDELCIVAFGGRSLVQLRLRRSDGRLVRQRSASTARLSDWISSGHLFAAQTGAADTELVLLTCQGTAVWLKLGWTPVTDDVDAASERPRIVRTVGGPDQSTLYCSRIVCGDETAELPWWQRQTFLGGTAFGELIVWRTVAAKAGGEVVAQQLQRISCHNGVIFSIDCDPLQRLLTTTSDDRSVKVWRLDDDADDTAVAASATADWSLTLQRTLFAHTSRVFRSRLLPGGRLLSGGEDGQLCLWLSQSGALLARQSLDTGALWHIDYEPRSQTAVVATAGGNCKQFCVAAYQRTAGESPTDAQRLQQQQQQQLQNGTATEVAVDSLRLPAGEHVVKVRFVAAATAPDSDPHLAIVTNRNRLVVGHPAGARWLFAADAVPFKIGVLEASGPYVAVAGQRQCVVYAYTGEAVQRCWHTDHDASDGVGAGGGMVRTVQFTVGGRFADVLIGDSAGNARLHIDWRQAGQRSVGLRMVPCREPWATAVCRPDERTVLIGDRCGHLHAYALDCGADAASTIALCDTLRHVHGRNAGITTLLPQRRRGGVVLCGGHDGTVKCIRYTAGGLQVLQTVAVPMSWVQSIRCDDAGHGFVAVGFESNRCVVWSSRRQEQLAVIECGGGHRFADVHLGADGSLASGSGHFAYLRRNVLRWLRFDMMPAIAFRPPAAPNNWHSLSCTCVEVLPLTGTCRADLLVSGGDDNLLKFHVLRHAAGAGAAATLTFLANVGTHVSSIKTLAIERTAGSNPNAWRIISAGGRAQICITDVALPPEYGGPHMDAQFEVHQRSVCGRQKGARNTNHVSAVEDEVTADAAHTDTRIMSVATFDGGSGGGFVAGCSTGRLRTFAYREADGDGRLTVDSAADYGRCILKVLAIDRGRRSVVVTAATDGRVCLWLASLETTGWQLAGQPFAHMAHHQSGVQSMDWMRSADPHHFQLVTGGDDQSVVVSRFEMQLPDADADADDQPHVSAVRTQSLAARHTAQVNGVRFGGNGRRLYTTGVDQTVWLWQPDEQSAWRPQRLVGRTAVADVKGVCTVCTQRAAAADATDSVLVFGYGVQMLDASR